MGLYLVRAGKNGEFENKFLGDNKIYLTWGQFNIDLTNIGTRDELRSKFEDIYPTASKGLTTQNTAQIWTFLKKISIGDWVVVPSKFNPVYHVAEVLSDYQYDVQGADPYFHYRDVKWIKRDLPKSLFENDKDIKYSLGAFSTICTIERNNSEARFKEIVLQGHLKSKRNSNDDVMNDTVRDSVEDFVEVESSSRQAIEDFIIQKYKGHELERLVEAILKASGYTTYRSPEGADGGVDILASQGALGFGNPKVCVQVKSSDSSVGTPELSQLKGTMQSVGADYGLMVSWGGFKQTVLREISTNFFKVRLWGREELIDNLLENYEKLDDGIKAEISLKRIWILAEEGGF